ncbi:unnamed protein product [Lampetra fluviatilis]
MDLSVYSDIKSRCPREQRGARNGADATQRRVKCGGGVAALESEREHEALLISIGSPETVGEIPHAHALDGPNTKAEREREGGGAQGGGGWVEGGGEICEIAALRKADRPRALAAKALLETSLWAWRASEREREVHSDRRRLRCVWCRLRRGRVYVRGAEVELAAGRREEEEEDGRGERLGRVHPQKQQLAPTREAGIRCPASPDVPIEVYVEALGAIVPEGSIKYTSKLSRKDELGKVQWAACWEVGRSPVPRVGQNNKVEQRVSSPFRRAPGTWRKSIAEKLGFLGKEGVRNLQPQSRVRWLIKDQFTM